MLEAFLFITSELKKKGLWALATGNCFEVCGFVWINNVFYESEELNILILDKLEKDTSCLIELERYYRQRWDPGTVSGKETWMS